LAIPVIILNWNGSIDTIQSVSSIKQQSINNYHIFLIDNNSETSDIENLRKKIPINDQITFIQNELNLGFARAHNRIFKKILSETDAEFIALLNNDAFAKPDWLEKLLNCAQKYNAGMVSSKMLFHERPHLINNLGHKFLNTGEILPIAWEQPANSHNEVTENAGASGGACLYSTKMLKEIGLFDEYFVTGYEDAELGLRAMLAGYKLMYEPKAIVTHRVGASINKVRDYKYALKLQLDLLYTYFKLMPTGTIIANMPFVLIRTIILFLLFSLWGRFSYFKIFFHGWYTLLSRDRKHLLSNRKAFKKHRKLSWFQIARKQEFFLLDNIKRFNTYFLKGKKTIFEQF